MLGLGVSTLLRRASRTDGSWGALPDLGVVPWPRVVIAVTGWVHPLAGTA